MGAILGACSKVPAGYVGVEVDMYGNSKGVDATALGPGRYWLSWNQELFTFPTFTQNYVWTKNANEGAAYDESINFQDDAGLAINADVGIAYHIPPTHVVQVFQKYREGVDEITHVALHNMVRDAFVMESSTRSIEDLMGGGKAAFLEAVNTDVMQQADVVGIAVENVYLIGNMRPPQAVTDAINNKIKANQVAEQKKNEVEQAKYDAQKSVAEAEGRGRAILAIAKSQATANDILSKSLTPTLLQDKWIQKWNGMQSSVVMGASSGAIPMFNIPMPPPNSSSSAAEALKRLSGN